jgi:hypothetical protein
VALGELGYLIQALAEPATFLLDSIARIDGVVVRVGGTGNHGMVQTRVTLALANSCRKPL